MAAIDIELPGGCVVEAGPVADRPLHPEEASAVARAIPKRRRQFASGRYFARRALHRLAGVSPPIPRGDRGRPVWPLGFIGSISHSEALAAAAVSTGPLRGIGIDVEDAQRFARSNPRLHGKLFTPAERSRTLSRPVEAAVTFSAKEAAYKAVNPLAPRKPPTRPSIHSWADTSVFGKWRSKSTGTGWPSFTWENTNPTACSTGATGVSAAWTGRSLRCSLLTRRAID